MASGSNEEKCNTAICENKCRVIVIMSRILLALNKTPCFLQTYSFSCLSHTFPIILPSANGNFNFYVLLGEDDANEKEQLLVLGDRMNGIYNKSEGHSNKEVNIMETSTYFQETDEGIFCRVDSIARDTIDSCPAVHSDC